MHPTEAGDLFQLLEVSGVAFNMEMVKKAVEEGLLSPIKVAPLRDWLKTKKKKKLAAAATVNGEGKGEEEDKKEEEERDDKEEESASFLTRSHNHSKFRHFPADFSLLRANLFHDDSSKDTHLFLPPSSSSPSSASSSSSSSDHPSRVSIVKAHSMILNLTESRIFEGVEEATDRVNDEGVEERLDIKRIQLTPVVDVTAEGLGVVLKLIYFGGMTRDLSDVDRPKLTPVMTADLVEVGLPTVMASKLPVVEKRCKSFLVDVIARFAAAAAAAAAESNSIGQAENQASYDEGLHFFNLLHLALRHSVKGVGEKAVEVLMRRQLPKSTDEMKKISLDVLWFILRTTTLLR